MSSDYQLEDTIYLPFTTRAFATGIPTALVSGVVDIYEDVTATPIVTAETLTVSLNGHAGFNMITVTATAASGFNVGGSYTAILDAGTVDSVSVVGEVVAHFTIDKGAAAQDLANGTDGLGAIKAETANILTDTAEIGAAGAGLTAINLPNQTMDITGNITGSLSGSVGSVTGAVGSVTAAVTIDAGSVDAIWDETLTAHVTADSAAVALKDILADTNELQGDDVPGLIAALNDIAAGDVWAVDATTQQTQGTFGQAIGDPVADTTTIYQAVATDAAGDNVSADVAAVKAETALIVADTGTDGVVVAAGAITATEAPNLDAAVSTRATPAQVNTEVLDVMDTDTITLPGQTAPPLAPTHRQAIGWLYKVLRNRKTMTATQWSLYDDAETTVDAKATVSDDATTAIKQEIVSGP